MLENLKIIREIFLKCFIISFVCIVFTVLLLIFNLDFFAGIADTLLGLDKQAYSQGIFILIGMYRNIVFLFFLVPLLAIHWTIKNMEK